MKAIHTSSAIIVFTLIIFIGCTKEGKQGEPGVGGKDGNANVSSYTFDVYAGDWSSNSAWLYNTNITQTIVNSGAVQVYMETSPYSGVWAALPLSVSGTEIIYAYQLNFVEVVASPQPTSHERFKVVTIASSSRLANPNLDYSDYEAVAKTFGLN